MLDLAQISRSLGVPYTALRELVRSGALIPDAVAGRQALFEEARLETLSGLIISRLSPVQRRHLAQRAGQPFDKLGLAGVNA